jgi:hypothetical protein
MKPLVVARSISALGNGSFVKSPAKAKEDHGVWGVGRAACEEGANAGQSWRSKKTSCSARAEAVSG